MIWPLIILLVLLTCSSRLMHLIGGALHVCLYGYIYMYGLYRVAVYASFLHDAYRVCIRVHFTYG